MRLFAVVVVVALAIPGRAQAQADEDELAPLTPVKPSSQPKRPKKKATPQSPPPPRETSAPLELTEPPAAEPKKPEAPPAPEPRATPTAAASSPGPGFEDPDLTAATQVSRKAGAPLTTVGWVAAGVGAAILVTGAVVGGLAASARSGLTVDSRGVVVSGDPEQAGAAVRLSRMATGLLVFGGAAAAGGLLLALWPASNRSSSALRLFPSAGPGTASLVLQGVWP